MRTDLVFRFHSSIRSLFNHFIYAFAKQQAYSISTEIVTGDGNKKRVERTTQRIFNRLTLPLFLIVEYSSLSAYKWTVFNAYIQFLCYFCSILSFHARVCVRRIPFHCFVVLWVFHFTSSLSCKCTRSPFNVFLSFIACILPIH